MALISCSECGREVSDKAPHCPGCGNPIAAPAPIESPAKTHGFADEGEQRRKIYIPLIIIAVVAAIGLCIFFVSADAPKQKVQSLLLKSWHVYVRDGGSVDTKWMTFDEKGYVVYEYETLFLGRSTLAMDRYEVLSPTEVKIAGTVYNIRFSDEATMLVFSPGIHGEDCWF